MSEESQPSIFKKIIQYFFVPKPGNSASNPIFLFKKVVSGVGLMTIGICVLLLIFQFRSGLVGVLNFLILAGACLAGGGAIGFLFGLPRAEKFRYIKPDGNGNDSPRDFGYSDNTNLEEVSDWLTKIIVGLSLVKFNTIMGWVDKAAHNFQTVMAESWSGPVPFNAYVFGYCSIVFYLLVGGGVVYLWARINLSQIFTDSRLAIAEKEKVKAQQEKEVAEKEKEVVEQEKQKLEVEKKNLIGQAQEIANKDLQEEQESSEEEETVQVLDVSGRPLDFDLFKKETEAIYNAKPLKDKTDPQAGRWGGNASSKNFVLEAIPDTDKAIGSMTTIILRVRSTMADPAAWQGFAAFFLHDTFSKQIVYVKAKNGLAEFKIIAYEGFVVGARTEDGTELELDINKVKGFPENFYYS